MVRWAAASAAIAIFGLAASATAECPSADSGTGVARRLDPQNKGDVDLIVSMSLMPKLLKVDYAKARSVTLVCDLTRFSADGNDYDLRASGTDAGTARVAIASAKNATVAELLPVTNIMAIIEASKAGRTAPVSGYMLATIGKGDVTGWRLYTAVPNQATLETDMTAALDGTLQPVFRTDATSGKTNIFVRVTPDR